MGSPPVLGAARREHCALQGRKRGVDVTWDRRSLYSFGEGDLAEYAARYDLVIFDHPFVGEAARAGYLLDLAPLILGGRDRRVRGRQRGRVLAILLDERPALGPAHRCRSPDGGLAPPIFWRPSALRCPIRSTTVLALAAAAACQGGSGWVFPPSPTDLLCTYISLVASDGEVPGSEAHRFVSPEASAAAMERLRAPRFRPAHPESRRWNPIACFDHMSSADDLGLRRPTPSTTSNYASLPERALRFGSPPRLRPGGPVHALLGGRRDRRERPRRPIPRRPFAYAAYLCAPGIPVRHLCAGRGGQPGQPPRLAGCGLQRGDGGLFCATRCQRCRPPTCARPQTGSFRCSARAPTGSMRWSSRVRRSATFLEWVNDGYARLAEPAASRAIAT